MTCPNAPLVHAFHDGQLPAAARADMDAHLAACGECAELLNDLRAVSRLVGSAPLPHVDAVAFDRFYDVWDAARQRAVLRISSWLTAAAAAVLLGSLVLFPAGERPSQGELAVANAALEPSWEPVALMAPVVEESGTGDAELVQVAQWMADDLGG